MTVIFAVRKQDGTELTYDDVLANLPVGYRPSRTITIPAEGRTSVGYYEGKWSIKFYPDGRVVFHSSNGVGAIDIGAVVTFLASS